MRLSTLALVGVLAAAALVAAPALAQDGSAGDDAAANVSVGGQLSVLVSAQQARVETAVEDGAFDVAFGERGGEAVSERARELAATMRELEEEKRAIEDARERGNLSEAAYRTRMAKLETRVQALNASANHTATTAEEGLSRAEQRGVNVGAIRELQRNASELTGPEVAALARSIAGPAMPAPRPVDRVPGAVGPPAGAGRPGDAAGPDGRSGDGAADRGGADDGDVGGPAGGQERPGGAGGGGGSASGGGGGGGSAGGGPR